MAERDETGLIKRPADAGVTAYTIRATAQTEPGNHMAKVGQFRHFDVRCDEPGLGGDSAPSPLGYAALSIGF